MSSSLHIGLDLGTTSTKACAFDDTGTMVAECVVAYELCYPEEGAAVQDAGEILEAAERALRQVIGEIDPAPAAIGISCAMHGVLLLDEDFEPLGPVITYADVRAQAVMEDFDQSDRSDLLRRTGTPVHPMSPLVKLRWLRREDPERFGRATYLGDLKSCLVARWTTAGFLLDRQLASATGLWSAETNDWYPPALDLALGSTDTGRLPRVVDPRTPLEWRPEVAERLGTTGIPLVIGGSDGCLANLGSDLLKPGEVAVTVGTSAAVRVTHRGRIDLSTAEFPLFNYVLYDDYRVLGGATNNGGKTLEWAYELFGGNFEDIGDMIERALAAEPTEIEFQPFLYGERAPIWDATATAGFSKLRGDHDAVDLARAVVVGLTDNLVRILEQVEAVTEPAKLLYVSGGITRSATWVKFLGERSGRPVRIVDTPQASAYGAALVAGMAKNVDQLS